MKYIYLACFCSYVSYAGIEGGTPLRSPVTDKEVRISSRSVQIDENRFVCVFPKNGELPTWKLSFESDPYNFYIYDGKGWKQGLSTAKAAEIKQKVEAITLESEGVKELIKIYSDDAKDRARRRVNRTPNLSNAGTQHQEEQLLQGELSYEDIQEIQKRALNNARSSLMYKLFYPLEEKAFDNFERNTDPNAPLYDLDIGTAEGQVFGKVNAAPFDLNKTETCPTLTLYDKNISKKLTFEMKRSGEGNEFLSATSMKASYYDSVSSNNPFSSFETKPWLTGTRGMAVIKSVGGEPSSDSPIDLGRR